MPKPKINVASSKKQAANSSDEWPEQYVPLGLRTVRSDMASQLLKDKAFKAVGTTLGESAFTGRVKDFDSIAERVRTRMSRGAKRQWHVIVAFGGSYTPALRYRKRSLAIYECAGRAQTVALEDAGTAEKHKGIQVMIFRTAPQADEEDSAAPKPLQMPENIEHRTHPEVLKQGQGMTHTLLKTFTDAVKHAEASSEDDVARGRYVKSALAAEKPGQWHVVLSEDVKQFGCAVGDQEEQVVGLIQCGKRGYLGFCHVDVDGDGWDWFTRKQVDAAIKVLYGLAVLSLGGALYMGDEWRSALLTLVGMCFAVGAALRIAGRVLNMG